MKENKLTSYLLYAMGEIVLVVIGIIIAVQINTWNDARLNHRKERVILKDLYQEFQINKTKLDETIRHHQSLAEATSKIMSLMGESEAVLSQHNLDS